MSLINWNTKTETTKLKEYEIVTEYCSIILKEDGSNFIEWKDAVAKHCEITGLDETLKFGPAPVDTDPPHQVHSLFPDENNFF